LINGKGQVELVYSSSAEFGRVYEAAMEAQRRSFNSEEHDCNICMRKLLGEKFFFLSGCEHFFCTECVGAMVGTAIAGGSIQKLVCADKGCKRPLNDLDVRNLGLSQQQLDKYDQISLNNAIA
jgi:hypothetical protein